MARLKRTGAIHHRGNNRWREKQIQTFSTSPGRGCTGWAPVVSGGVIIGEINEPRFKDDQKKASYCNKHVSQQRIVSRSPADLLLPDTEPRSPLRSSTPKVGDSFCIYMERGVSRSRRFIDENYERWSIMQRASRELDLSLLLFSPRSLFEGPDTTPPPSPLIATLGSARGGASKRRVLPRKP